MDSKVALIGNGEAGRAFDLAGTWRAFDLLADRTRHASLAEALATAEVIFSVVTADQALAAAQAASRHLAEGALFLDMNSVAPDTKRAAAQAIEAGGGCYLDVAVMSPVLPKRLATPLLVSGPHAGAALEVLGALGFSQVRAVGSEVGRASTIKMLRSVMVKGIEALTDEMMRAADAADVTHEVLTSLEASERDWDWFERAAYNLDRMAAHGARRAAEMEESANTLAALGIDPVMTRGTVVRQRNASAQKDFAA